MSFDDEIQLDPSKGIISVVSDHDDYFRNESLGKLFNDLLSSDSKDFESNRKILDNFYFVFTGGTFNRVFHSTNFKTSLPLLTDSTKEWLKDRTIQLPSFDRGGVSVLTYLLLQSHSKTIWSFQSPDSPHHIVSQNSILRLASNVNGIKRLINTRTVKDWIFNEHYREELPSESSDILNRLKLPSGKPIPILRAQDSKAKIEPSTNSEPDEKILLCLVRQEFSEPFRDFLEANVEKIFRNFNKVIITDTKNLKELIKARPFYSKYEKQFIFCNPMGIGGLIEATVQILYKECDTVIFYDDLGEYIKEGPTIDELTAGEIEDPFLHMLVTLQMISFNYQVILAVCKINQNVLVKRTKKEVDSWVNKLK